VPDPAFSIDGNVSFVVRKLTFQRQTTIETFVNFVNVMFTNVNEKSLGTVDMCVNKVNVAFTNVDATALNVRGDVPLIFRCAAPTSASI
jgi:hypothetical protein